MICAEVLEFLIKFETRLSTSSTSLLSETHTQLDVNGTHSIQIIMSALMASFRRQSHLISVKVTSSDREKLPE